MCFLVVGRICYIPAAAPPLLPPSLQSDPSLSPTMTGLLWSRKIAQEIVINQEEAKEERKGETSESWWLKDEWRLLSADVVEVLDNEGRRVESFGTL